MSIEAADVLDHLVGSPQERRLLVAVDGVDASGKTTFAEWLAEALRSRGRSAHLIHVDDFMHVRSVRHRRGRNSPEGYFHDSYDYESLTRYVLEPLTGSGDGWFRAATIDRLRDVVIRSPLQYADVQTITIVEGLFLLRDELVDWWDYSIFLDVGTDTALARKGRRDGLVLSPGNPLTRRYVEGQRIYLEGCQPSERATWVLDNVDSKPARRDACHALIGSWACLNLGLELTPERPTRPCPLLSHVLHDAGHPPGRLKVP